jgi:hypothetical protein
MKQHHSTIKNSNLDQTTVMSRYKVALYCMLVIIVGLLLYIVVASDESRISQVSNKITYLNPALAVLDKKDLIVNFQGLRDSLTTKYESRDDYLISIYFPLYEKSKVKIHPNLPT